MSRRQSWALRLAFALFMVSAALLAQGWDQGQSLSHMPLPRVAADPSTVALPAKWTPQSRTSGHNRVALTAALRRPSR